MLTQKELSTYSLEAEQGTLYSLCALAVEKLLNPAQENEGRKQLENLAAQDASMLVFLALSYLSKGDREKTLIYLAKAIDEGDSYAPYYMWKLMQEDRRYLELSKSRGNLLAYRASVRSSPSFGTLDSFLEDHGRGLEKGDFDSFYFCCSDGFAYYKPELGFLKKRLYTPLLKSLFDTSNIDVETTELAALAGIKDAFPLQAKILMEQKKWSEALFWLLPEENNDSEQQKDIGLCYLEMFKRSQNQSHYHQALLYLTQAQQLGSLDAADLLRPYKNQLKFLSPNHWVYLLPSYWIFYIIVAFCLLRLGLFFIFPLYTSEIIACSLGVLIGTYIGTIRVPSFVYALSEHPRIIKHGIRQGDMWALAKDERYIHRAANQNHLQSMYRMGIHGNTDYLREAADQQHIPSILSLYEQEPEKLIEVLTSISYADSLEVHHSLGMKYFEKSDFLNASHHLSLVLAKTPDDIQVKRTYAWSVHQRHPFQSQWLLSQLAESGDMEALFRLQELQRFLDQNKIPFPIEKPDIPYFPEKPFLRPQEDLLPYLSNLSTYSIRNLTEKYGDGIWLHCDADLRLKQKLRKAEIGMDFYPKSTNEQLKEHAKIFCQGLQELRKEHQLHLSIFDKSLYHLLQQSSTTLEALLLLEPKHANFLHDYNISSLVQKAFVCSSENLKTWVLEPITIKKREELRTSWENTLHPLSEVFDATKELLEWLTNHQEIPFPPPPTLVLEVKVAQSLLLEFLQSAPIEDFNKIISNITYFWEATAFCNVKTIKRFILSLEISTKDKEKLLQSWQFHNKLQRLYEDSTSSKYAQTTIRLVDHIIEAMTAKEISYRPLPMRLYHVPFDKFPEAVITILLNESNEPLSLLGILENSKKYNNLYDFYQEDIKETGNSFFENRKYHTLKNYLLLRSLMQKGLIKRSMFEHKA